MTFGEKAFEYLINLQPDFKLPEGIDVMVPFENDEVLAINKEFFSRFYADNKKRTLILGINPGRFGAGITGIPFTDPIRLENVLKIANSFQKKQELSSVFIYSMIDAFGGPKKFFGKFFISAISPLGFVKGGKNINYYDEPALQSAIEPFVIKTIREQIDLGCSTDNVVCLGEGKNYNYLKKVNDRYGFFKEIHPLAHPRFILQYRRKMLDEYLEKYVGLLNSI